MPAFADCGWIKRAAIAGLAVVGVGLAHLPPTLAQTRTLASLADVPAFVPAPYHPHMSSSYYSSALYDSHPYYGGVYLGGGAHFWH
ncbi:MAG TPA: hypothetical protein VG651_05225 [Stellaceae bacterium]|nr:hypothetical protein [Stellaceae bacterium]